jgi:hypothetical protein
VAGRDLGPRAAAVALGVEHGLVGGAVGAHHFEAAALGFRDVGRHLDGVIGTCISGLS